MQSLEPPSDSQNDPLDDAVDADVVERDDTDRAPLTDSILALGQTHRLGAASREQRVVYAILAHTLLEYRADRIMVFVGYLLIPFTMMLGMLGAFAVTALAGWILLAIGLGDALVWLVAGVALLIGRALQGQVADADIRLSRASGKIDGFKLGRLEEIFQIAGPATLGIFFGAIFGVQHAILMWAPNHLGLSIDGHLGECFLLTLDNVCHGIFLDTFELYDLNWGQDLEHTYYSATVFYAFRVAFDALAFLIGYALWKRYQLSSIFNDLPADARDVPGLLAWIDARCGDKAAWSRHYHDEMLFLLLSRAFIVGDFDFVSQLSGSLRRLAVKPEVRDLFQVQDGTTVFTGSYR